MCHRYDVAAMPGCFTPTEILAAWEAGADIVKVFPATALGPGFFKDVRGPLPQVKLMPTGGVSRSTTPATGSRPGPSRSASGTALLDAKAIAAGAYDVITANAKTDRGERPAARCRQADRNEDHEEDVTFGEIMLRLSPPGFERFFQSPVLGATFGGGEANVAVSLAQFGLDSHFVTRLPAHAHRRRRRSNAARRGRPHGVHRSRRRSRRHLLRRGGRQPARVERDLRPRALRRSPRCSRAR